MAIHFREEDKLTRSTLIEKVYAVILNENFNSIYDVETPSHLSAWYIDSKYQNRKFLVRNATKGEFEDMQNSSVLGNKFKARCSAKGFYVIVEKGCFEMFIGKIDCKLI